jgi:hypothetical protein
LLNGRSLEILDLVNKGELEDVDGIDDIKDFINEKNESAKISEPLLKQGSIRRWFYVRNGCLEMTIRINRIPTNPNRIVKTDETSN